MQSEDDADDGAAVAPDDGQAPKAEVQSADTAAADGGSGGTTISIAVYRSSFPIEKWDLNDDDFGLTEAEWAWENRTGELPKDASPGSEVAWPESGKPADYAEPTRAGFEFAGWSTDGSASAGGFIDGSSPKLTMPEGAPESKSCTLYALWTPLEYSVVFHLAKNPMDGNGPGSDASYALNWESDSGVNRTVTNLGGGRFRVDGFTMDERTYDEATRTVGLPEPSRTGYRFLGWAEPDGQRLAIDNAARDGYALNPVRLTQLDGTPVLTARWASAFGVTAPLSVTFGDYDKTGAPGNPWLGDANVGAGDDTTQSEADDTDKPEQEGYEALGQAYFENTGWHEAVKVVGLSSERDPSANQVLTTYDSRQASEAAVLGDGTEANPGERLLSLYPSASAPVDKSSGVHFRLSDSLDEAALGSSFTMGAQGSGSEKLPITYGLNLSTDPTDNSANHGLVLPTNDYERKQIATVSYTFATATATAKDAYRVLPAGDTEVLYVDVTSGFLEANDLADTVMPGIYGLEAIKAAANDLSDNGEASLYWPLYYSLCLSGEPFKLKVGSTYHDVQVLGVCQDTRSDDGRKAGLSFGFKGFYTTRAMNSSSSKVANWNNCDMRTYLQGTFFSALDESLQDPQTGIVGVDKRQTLMSATNMMGTSSNQTVFLIDLNEIFGVKPGTGVSYEWFQYQYYAQNGAGVNPNPLAIKSGLGVNWYWTRTGHWNTNTHFRSIISTGTQGTPSGGSSSKGGVVPCFCL